MLFESSSQGNDFCPPEKRVNITNMDKLRKNLSSLVKRNLSVVQEGLRGIEDDQETKEIRKSIEKNLNNIDNAYASSVLETSKIMDRFAKQIDDQKVSINNILGENVVRDEKKINILNGMKEDTATFQRLGNVRYRVFFIIAIVCVIFAFIYVKIESSPYLILAAILTCVFLFINTLIYRFV